MAEPLQQSNATATATANPSAAASSSSRDNRDASAATTSSSASHVRQEEDASIHRQFQQPEHENNINFFGRFNWGFNNASSVISDDSWSCIIVLFTFWFFVSLTLILGVYGSMNLLLGPHSSILLQPNPLFVQYIKVENLDGSKSGAMLYGIYGSPALDVITNWAETLNVSVPSDSHKEWIYYLNEGSQLNISYSLGSASSSIFLIIAEGSEGLAQWLENPTYPNTALSWNIIQGTGMITQNIFTSSSYYVAVGNLNKEVEVELNLRVMAFTYNTTNAYYKCTLHSNPCGLSVFFPEGNAVVLATPGPEQNTSSDGSYVKLSYGPRWITYILGMGGMTLLLFMVFNYINKLQCSYGERAAVNEEPASQGAPLLSYKDDDLSSWGSSCDSLSQDEKDLDFLTGASVDGKSPGDGETSSNTRRLCAICFDAPRDCFFLPCGHCVACFACGTRLAEADGTCPVCRRNMKKVRRIFTV